MPPIFIQKVKGEIFFCYGPGLFYKPIFTRCHLEIAMRIFTNLLQMSLISFGSLELLLCQIQALITRHFNILSMVALRTDFWRLYR